jgi:membrane fusion protein, heavy metal efflux system
VQDAQPRTLAVTHVTGRLYWNEDTTVGVFTPVAGKVTKINVDLGQPISIGTSLAEIDSPDFAQALANARTAVGNLAAADKAYSRSKELLAHGAAAAKDVEAAEAAFVAAVAERDRAEAVLANYGGKDKSTNAVYILRSPIAGDLVDKNINPGQELRADLMLANAPTLFTPIFVVSDPTKLWLQLDVAESDLPSLQPGLRLQIFSRSFPGKTFDGVVDRIGSTMDPSTRTVKIRGIVNNPDKLLKAEMYVLVDVVQAASKAGEMGVEVSSKALFMKGDDSFVFLEDAPGTYERKQVKVGIEKDNKVPIFEGVSPGQKVVVEGALLLQSIVEPSS